MLETVAKANFGRVFSIQFIDFVLIEYWLLIAMAEYFTLYSRCLQCIEVDWIGLLSNDQLQARIEA